MKLYRRKVFGEIDGITVYDQYYDEASEPYRADAMEELAGGN